MSLSKVLASRSSRGVILDASADNRQLRRSVLSLAWPAVMEQTLQMTVSLADVAMVGRLGAQAVAAVGISNQVVMLTLAVFAAISTGTTVIVARFIGARSWADANETARQSLVLTAILSVILSIFGWIYARPLLGLALRGEPDPLVLEMAVGYFRIVTSAILMGLVLIVVNGILRGAGDTLTPMIVTGVCNVLNILGNWVLIFGLGPIPAMGVRGAALSSALARSVGAIIVLVLLYRGRTVIHLHWREKFRPRLDLLKQVLTIGIPAAIEQLVMRGGQFTYYMIIVGLGTAAMAAHEITLNTESLSFMPGFGFALAATTLVGQYLGAKSPQMATRAGWEACRVAVLIMGGMGLIFFIFARPMIGFFIKDPEVVNLGVICLRIVAVSQPFLAMVMVLAGGLRGAGDTFYVMTNTLIGIWGIRVVLAYVLAIHLGMGLVGAWIAMTVDLIVRGFLYYARYHSGRWQEKGLEKRVRVKAI